MLDGQDQRGRWRQRTLSPLRRRAQHEERHELADRLTAARTDFVIEPHIHFKGEPGEQATMFFLDPSGNAIEFKAFEHIENLFAK